MNRADYYSLKLKDLPLQEVDQRLCRYQRILQRELRRKGVSFDFHLWVSDEWFCPDGVPGFALPFYLFHPMLMKLQKKEMGFVEGTTEKQILKLMRHELGHAIDNAFKLRKAPGRELVFGSSEQDYPDSYQPQKYSRSYVHYLGDNYAQSHPDEDFAETFAYWLDPEKDWKNKSLSSVVESKIKWLDKTVKHGEQKLKNKYRIDPIEKNTKTLKSYYSEFKKQKGEKSWERLDHNLRSTFRGVRQGSPLSQLIRKAKKHMVEEAARQFDVPRYEVEFAMNKLAERAQGLGVLATPDEFQRKGLSLLKKNFRYLKSNNQLRFYL